MRVNVISSPALNSDTRLRGSNIVYFNVYIESESLSVEWEAQLWHDSFGEEVWKSLWLEKPKHACSFVDPEQRSSKLKRNCFEGSLSALKRSSNVLHFTIRFRKSSAEAWRWVNDENGFQDGRVIIEPAQVLQPDIKDYLRGLDSELSIDCVESEAPDTSVWSISGKTFACEKEHSSFTFYSVGEPQDYTQWFALVRQTSAWLAPRHGCQQSFADGDAVLYSFRRLDGTHLVLLPVSGINHVLSVLVPDGQKLVLRARSDDPNTGSTTLLVSVGFKHDDAVAAAIYQARHLVSQASAPTLNERGRSNSTDKTQSPTSIREWYDFLTYCTWNGLGRSLSHEKIIDALDQLTSSGIKGTLLIPGRVVLSNCLSFSV